VLLVGIGACLIANAALCLGTLIVNRRLWRRRTQTGQEEAERWEAFRRYLSDFPRLQEAPPATLALWERYLVYGIAFGIAERVLQGAQLHMPEALHEASSIYWISSWATSAQARRACRSATSRPGSSALAPELRSGGSAEAREAAEGAAAGRRRVR
jgi:uncharacterized membrane protein